MKLFGAEIDELDSTPMEKKPEAATKSEGDTSSKNLLEGGSFSGSSSKTTSLATLQKIAAALGGGNVPEFIKEKIESLTKVKMPTLKSRRGLPPRPGPPKKPKQTKTKTKPKPEFELDESDSDYDSEDEILFDVFVTNSDRLPIPYEISADCFPNGKSSLLEQPLQITDPLNRLWSSMAFVSFDEEEAFVLTRNWARYASEFNLKLMDTVRFMKPNPRLGKNHFKTQHFPWSEPEPVRITLPQFLPANFLFQVELTQRDIGFRRLVLKKEQVWVCFPGIKESSEMVKFTDYRDKDWYVVMIYSSFLDGYMVIDGWEAFVKEHELGPDDYIRFYKPDIRCHVKTFLIEFVKREQGNQGGSEGHQKGLGLGQSGCGPKDKGKSFMEY